MVPMPHFGLVLPLEKWRELSERLTEAGTEFMVPPSARFVGEPGEQHTMFFRDPFGSLIEIKGFPVESGLFAH